MCRPSCCNNSSHGSGGTGLAVVAIVLAVALVAARIGPAIAETGRIALDVIRIAALGIGSAVVLAAVIWLAVRHARRPIRRRPTQQLARRMPGTYVTGFVPASEQSCLACGDKGRIVQEIGSSAFLVRPCPDCRPAQLAR